MPDAAMTKDEILRWALLTAYLEHWQVILDGKVSTNPWHYIPLIYSRHFAKAFWREDWEEHHRQLLWHRDGLLAYLKQFL
jgi:hypothetical protein